MRNNKHELVRSGPAYWG